jgi:arginyl-tRNA synthetase
MRTGETESDDENLDDAKIIVRSNGTVTYVGKDIAYQLWKFGLLGKDFHYRRFHEYPGEHAAWMTATDGDADAPEFGRASRVYNVIDARQSYLQTVVVAGVRALGYDKEADSSNHFSYEMVGLSPRCAKESGIELSPEDAKKGHVEVSGRKGQGVKADDLLDTLEAAALKEVQERHPDLPAAEQHGLAHKVAVAALRFFMLRFTRNSVIAFDFQDALSFEGETGPYLQYSVVRAQNIFRKLKEAEPDFSPADLPTQVTAAAADTLLSGEAGDDLWELALAVSEFRWLVQAALREQEPATVAKWAFNLAQRFNLFYHKHHILREPDAARKAFLLLLADTVQRQLTQALALLGIEVPEKM